MTQITVLEPSPVFNLFDAMRRVVVDYVVNNSNTGEHPEVGEVRLECRCSHEGRVALVFALPLPVDAEYNVCREAHIEWIDLDEPKVRLTLRTTQAIPLGEKMHRMRYISHVLQYDADEDDLNDLCWDRVEEIFEFFRTGSTPTAQMDPIISN